MHFKSRAEYLYKLTLVDAFPGAESSSPDPEINDVRRRLLILSQRTRFSIFQLLRREKRALNREQIAEALNLPPDKLYTHLYVMLKEHILLVADKSGAERNLCINESFVGSVIRTLDR